jgi:hypothetical protein
VLLGVVVARGEGPRRLYQQLFVGWADNFALLRVVFWVWVLSTLCLAVGLATRLSAVIVWALTVSFINLNPELHDGGDAVRVMILFLLMFCPSGAAWSLDSRRQRWLGLRQGPVYVPPWPLRLLLILLALIYCSSGLVKLLSPFWRDGSALYYTLAQLQLTRMSLAQVALPAWLLRLMTWSVLFWEVSFPLWLLFRWTRPVVLTAGVLFHLGTLVLMELGGFEFCMLVLYLPLLPWGRWLGEQGAGEAHAHATTPAVPAPRALGWGSHLLGAFVLWQLVYLAAGCLGSYFQHLAVDFPAEQRASAEEVAPGWAGKQGHVWDLLQRVRAVTDFWGDLTEQTHVWAMYQTAPLVSDMPVIDITYPVEPDAEVTGAAILHSAVWAWSSPRGTVADCALALWLAHSPVVPSVSETVLWPSDYEPRDPRSYFRLGELRLSRLENWLVPQLPLRGEESDEEWNELLAREIADFVGRRRQLIVNFLAYRVKQAYAQKRDMAEPEEVILSLRRYWTNPPGSPDIWSGPEDMPIARWLPGEEGPRLVLQAYNPATDRFEFLPSPEDEGEN